MVFIAGFIAWKADEVKPRLYSIGKGDTLVVRTSGYDFCPKYCKVDHFHFGHKKNYNCKTDACHHIIYEDRLN